MISSHRDSNVSLPCLLHTLLSKHLARRHEPIPSQPNATPNPARKLTSPRASSPAPSSPRPARSSCAASSPCRTDSPTAARAASGGASARVVAGQPNSNRTNQVNGIVGGALTSCRVFTTLPPVAMLCLLRFCVAPTFRVAMVAFSPVGAVS